MDTLPQHLDIQLNPKNGLSDKKQIIFSLITVTVRFVFMGLGHGFD